MDSAPSSLSSLPPSPRTRSPSLSDDSRRLTAASPDDDDDNNNNNTHAAPPRELPESGRMSRAGTLAPAGKSMPSSTAPAAQPTARERARGPLRLLDLPVDILKDIIHQLPHTNDLTSLSLCHSALHRLTVPCIYSRFDIVWPDESTHSEPRSGVDALTYGLATLVMGDDCFPHQNRSRHQCSVPATASKRATRYPITRRRFGNYYAQFTKKFSLGNGPAAWVHEYMITKEGGKMLGTLVALAIARMVNLETFVWDMPTGVLRDVWLALSSLADRTDGDDCRLERLWIRWHDNSIDAPVPPPAPPMILNNVNVPPPPPTGHPSAPVAVQPSLVVPPHFHAHATPAIDRVEHPTFSVIPPLKSLSVLDIDELPYLDEMSILIARSQDKLRELRVGIAPQAQQRDWVAAWEGEDIQQVDYDASWTGASAIGEKRLGGVLGVLVGRVHNLRHSEEQTAHQLKSAAVGGRPLGLPVKFGVTGATPTPVAPLADREPDHTTDHFLFGHPLEPVVSEGVSIVDEMQSLNIQPPVDPWDDPYAINRKAGHRASAYSASSSEDSVPVEERLTGMLKLEVLELERVPLSVPVLLKAFDWSLLTTLTLLNCSNHEQLWKSLRRTYTPRSPYPNGSPSSSKAYKASYTLRTEYSLNLKKIHTNTVSPSLISFLKETLAPNSLEVLFLQEGRSYQSTVTVDAIYRGPLRRHRASLKKLMIDSSEKGQDGHATGSSRWRRWMLNHNILTFITSGKMNNLRELAVSIDYKDWHHFLQRLPHIPHIRSLYIPYIADHLHGNNIDPRELAYQILDIVHLRPEIELCYMGLSSKCFEILENRPSNYDLRHEAGHATQHYAAEDPGLLSEDESEATEDEEDEMDAGGAGFDEGEDDDESEEGESVASVSEDESLAGEGGKRPKLRVREILFYEERVEAFRRRHGVLRP
ncbi:uncharacterized protein CC84DRAFT_364537 [Paraphaeosphaeria sporulosa]|uniref:F-box domain-containing protein n=1 Tax=Paraphaeosphaeria sporulosa TaxID=1460663 RepID=A0A177BYX6_9PLEO|nr:uncharacterized protein CC84DRAFT_364537 [Paraphaeosphaeria sporulosa]OAF99539.1 hypothetical protein CC84DRAFT_364537 [Paraphaeosphaeria sporulosa]